LTDGANIASAKTVGALAEAGAEVVMIGLESPEAKADRTGLSPAVTWVAAPGPPRGALRSLLSRRPYVAARHDTPGFRTRLDEALAEPWDAIVLDQYAMVWAIQAARRARNPSGRRPMLLHFAHDFETEVTAAIAHRYRGNPLRRLALKLNAMKTAAAERELARACNLMVTVTDEDARSFRSFNRHLRTLVCFLGYDGKRAGPRSLQGLPRSVCIVGSYRWIAKQMNLESFLRTADAIFARAGVALDIIGDAPEDFRERLAPGLKATRFVGFVPDLTEAMAGYRMGLIVEETGGGFKLKSLDYIFGRIPVGALAGSFRGIPAAVSENFIVRKDSKALAEAVVAALDDLDDLTRRQDRAFAAADDLFHWRENGRRILEAIVAGTRSR